MGSLLIAVIFLVFVSLGLPDSLLGSAWPTMQTEFAVPSSYAGYVSMTISAMTIISALCAPRLIQKIHTKWIVVVSITLTIIGLLGFSFSSAYYQLFIFAVPYGLGAGAIDAAMNHYVANHYRSNIMNFLHCFYGVGAIVSPNIMSLALKYANWNEGYRWTSYVQMGILAVVLLSLPLWKKNEQKDEAEGPSENAGLGETLKQRGVIFTSIAFFSYCAGEATCFLWTASYFAGTRNDLSAEQIASFGSLIFLGLMLGRLLAGFVSNRWGDRLLIRIGIAVEFVGIVLVAIPFASYWFAVVGFVVIGTGMGPIYPAIQHMAPANFGKKYSASAIGMQMASAYVGSTFMPMVFGLLQESVGIQVMPYYVLICAVLCLTFLEITYRVIRKPVNPSSNPQ